MSSPAPRALVLSCTENLDRTKHRLSPTPSRNVVLQEPKGSLSFLYAATHYQQIAASGEVARDQEASLR